MMAALVSCVPAKFYSTGSLMLLMLSSATNMVLGFSGSKATEYIAAFYVGWPAYGIMSGLGHFSLFNVTVV